MSSHRSADGKPLDLKQGVVVDAEGRPLGRGARLAAKAWSIPAAGWLALLLAAGAVPILLLAGTALVAGLLGFGAVLWLLRAVMPRSRHSGR
jgi:hypothetical protein